MAAHVPVAAELLLRGADPAALRQGMDVTAWHRSRGRDDVAQLLDLHKVPARAQSLVRAGSSLEAIAVATDAVRLAERWLAGTPLVAELQQVADEALRLRSALEEAQLQLRAEEYAAARCAFTHARQMAPESKKVAEQLAQLEPLCKMQAALRQMQAEQSSTAQGVASAAMTPPRGQKTLSRTHSGRPAINAAAVHRLLDSGAPLNERDECGRTALLWSVENGLVDLISLLLTRTEGERADPNVIDKEGRSALHLANTPAVAAILLRAGSSRQAKNSKGRTPEAQHRRYDRNDVADLIAEQGEILHLQGLAERRLVLGDATGSSEAYRDALELCSATGVEEDSGGSVTALRRSLEQGQKRASGVAEALSTVGADTDVLSTALPLLVELPESSTVHEDEIYRRAGVIQCILSTRAPGRWTVTRCMGIGASGLVVAASDTIRQGVAVKLVMPEQEQFGKAQVRRLRREAQAMMRVQDAHVCAAFDSFFFPNECHPKAFVIIMEEVKGQTLAAELRERMSLSEVDTACVCSDLLRGLQAVHSGGLVHRDLKPSNICATEGEAGGPSARQSHKLIDFGLARAGPEAEEHGVTDTLLEHTQEGNQVGTPHYMAPEQWGAQWGSIDARSDLWAVGVLAYQMLTGTLPFGHGRTETLAVWSAVVEDAMPSLKAAAPDVSDSMVEWVAKALQKKQDDRFCSASEMAEALQKALVADGLSRYSVFLNYRVKTDSALASSLFTSLSVAGAGGAQSEGKLSVYLDKVRLVDGQRWDQGFVAGLRNSDVFVPLVSLGAIEPMTRLVNSENGSVDNVLLEWMLALWLFQNGHIKSILPVLLGEPNTDKANGGWQSLFDGLGKMEKRGQVLPSIVHEPTRFKAVAALRQLGLDAGMGQSELEGSFDAMTVAKTAEMVMCYQGLTLWEAEDRETALRRATERVAQAARSLLSASGTPATPKKAPCGEGGGKKLGSMLANSVMGMMQLRQELAQAHTHAATQARQISDLSLAQHRLTSERDAAVAACKQSDLQHPGSSYTGQLISTLQADNSKLNRQVAKYKGLATERQTNLKALRSEHVALAHQATETRQLAYDICTGNGRLNSNSSARLHLGVTRGAANTTSAERHMLNNPSLIQAASTKADTGDLNAGLRQVTRGNQSQRLTEQPRVVRRKTSSARSARRSARPVQEGNFMRPAENMAMTVALPLVRQTS